MQSGDCIKVLGGFDQPVSSCAFTANGQTIITGSFDKGLSIAEWNLIGERTYTWPTSHRTEDLALSPDERWLIAMDEQQRLHVYNYATREHVYNYQLSARATSLSFSIDSKHVLVNKTDNEALLINIETRDTVQRYIGHTGGNYTIRSDFGGANENFVISGSEGEGTLMLNLTCNLTLTCCRWPSPHLAQDDRVPGSRTRSPQRKLQRGGLESHRPVHVCHWRRRWEDQDVSTNHRQHCPRSLSILTSLSRRWSNADRKRMSASLPVPVPVPSAAKHSNGTTSRSSNGSLVATDLWA